ncbi:MAG: hypothetical protein IPM18_04575 [Phycisphaerales bacterium]|nr:hypothetical protein [Phycisphaerales bacterium]
MSNWIGWRTGFRIGRRVRRAAARRGQAADARGIFWMLDNAKWKDLPREFARATVHRWFQRWTREGLF